MKCPKCNGLCGVERVRLFSKDVEEVHCIICGFREPLRPEERFQEEVDRIVDEKGVAVLAF